VNDRDRVALGRMPHTLDGLWFWWRYWSPYARWRYRREWKRIGGR